MALSQIAFRFREDDEDENDATWAAALNTNISREVETITRLRIATESDAADSINPALWFSRNGGAWTKAKADGTTLVDLEASAFVTDGTATTQQITTGTFKAGQFDFTAFHGSVSMSAGDKTESEYCFQILATANNGDTIDFRCEDGNGDPSDDYGTYTEVGRITVGVGEAVVTPHVYAGTRKRFAGTFFHGPIIEYTPFSSSDTDVLLDVPVAQIRVTPQAPSFEISTAPTTGTTQPVVVDTPPVDVSDYMRADRLVAARLCEMEFDEGTFRVWTGTGQLVTGDGKTWDGVGKLGAISTIRDADTLEANEFVVGLRRAVDGVEIDPDKFAAALNTERHRDVYNRAIRMYWQIADPDTLQLINNPIAQDVGLMSHIVTRRQGTEAVEIQLHCESLMAEGRKPAHRYYTDADQKARFPDDDGFAYIAANAGRRLTWPRD